MTASPVSPPEPRLTGDAPDALAGVQRRAGLMLVALLLLLAGSALYVLYARGVFEPKQQLVLLSDEAEGAQVGMDLTFAGFPIGRVERIELGDDGVARLVVDVPRKHARWLRTTSVVTMERSLVGGTRLRAYSGVLTDPPLPDGAQIAVLKGDATADIPKLVSAVRDLLDNLNGLTGPQSPLAHTLSQVATTTERLNGKQGALGVLMGNEDDARRVLATLERTQALLARLDGVAQRTDRLLANADERVFGPQGLGDDARHLARQASELLAQLQATAARVQASLQRVDALLADGQTVAANARDASADLGALRAEVEVSLRALQGMVRDIQRRWPFGPAATDVEVRLP